MVISKATKGRRTSRRDFLKTSTAVVGGAVAAGWSVIPGAYAAGSDEIRVGVIGCGARGTGAADDALKAAPNVKLVAMGDVFKDHLDKCLAFLKKEFGDQIDIPEDRCFVGLDAYEKVLASDINYVILATPPGFRPLHLKASVAAGKHIFCEKPVAVDGTGIRACYEVLEESKKKGMAIGVGTQRHHQTTYLETLKRVHDGAIGEIVGARAYWNQGPIWVYPREDGWSDLEWQLRDWYYFTWLCGDHIVEQHVHNLDVVNWAMHAHPVRAVGLGGRQARTGPEYGHIFDHFAIDYEYENGVHMMSMCRQIPNCANSVSEALVGTKGFCQADRATITGETNWRFRGEKNSPFDQEHTDLIASIRAGKPYNELEGVIEGTLTAIMGRMSAYTGKEVTWEQALNSKEELVPADLAWDMSIPVPPVAMPGKTELV